VPLMVRLALLVTLLGALVTFTTGAAVSSVKLTVVVLALPAASVAVNCTA